MNGHKSGGDSRHFVMLPGMNFGYVTVNGVSSNDEICKQNNSCYFK